MPQRLIFLDTETTGLSPASAKIVEIAAVELSARFVPVRIFHEYLDPGCPVGSTSRIHGLTDGFLRGRKGFADVAGHLLDFIDGATVYAHNLPFDRKFLNAELAAHGFAALESRARLADTLTLARSRVTGGASLDRLVGYFGLDGSVRAAHHGALIDAELLARVWLCLQGRPALARQLDFEALNLADGRYQQTCNPGFSDDEDDGGDGYGEGEEPVDGIPAHIYCDDYWDKLQAILAYADENPDFDASTFEGILDNWIEWGNLTEGQRRAIDNVYYGFGLD